MNAASNKGKGIDDYNGIEQGAYRSGFLSGRPPYVFTLNNCAKK